MAANRDSEAILDIANAAQQIQSAMQSVTLDQFKRTREKQAAILYFCIIIGKATKRISSELKSQYSDVPWREMAGLRAILAHQYDRLDTETIWDITQTNIPELLSNLQPILKTFESDPLVFVIKSINWLQVFPAVFTRKTISTLAASTAKWGDRLSAAELWQKGDRSTLLGFGGAIAHQSPCLELRREYGGSLKGDGVLE